MILKVKQNTIKLILRMLNNKRSTQPVINIPPQKNIVFDGKRNATLPRSTPKQEGVNPEIIESFFNEIDNSDSIYPHTVMILKNGKVIAEKDYPPYSLNYWATTYSMCKTITGLAIGFLVEDGLITLDTKYQSLFETNPLLINFAQRDITVEHLLTMSACVEFNEAGSVTSTNWIKDFLAAGVKMKPGENFMYNSMNSYMLSAIVSKLTGKSLCEYLEEKLFKPLDFGSYFWEKCPKGIEKGGWGLYILPEDMAKLGLLFLNKGTYNGKRIISEKWIEESMRPHVKVPEYVGKYNYGYHIWVSKKPHMAIMNGMFGQNVFVLPDSGYVIVQTSGNSDVFQSNEFFPLVEKYFCDDNPPKSKKMERTKIPPATQFKDKIIGKTIYITSVTSEKTGLLPAVLQAMQNNYTQGLDKLSFSQKEKNTYECTFTEGTQTYTIPFAFDNWVTTDIEIGGEKYTIAGRGEYAHNEDNEEVLKLSFCFLETASVRNIKIILEKSKVKLKFFETPGKDFLLKMIMLMPDYIKKNKLFMSLIKNVDIDYFNFRLTSALEPELLGTFDPNSFDPIYDLFKSKIDLHRNS